MTEISPDRTFQFKSTAIKVLDRGRASSFIVVSDASRGGATFAWLIEMGPENEMGTTAAVIEEFADEASARAAYPQIPDDTSVSRIR